MINELIFRSARIFTILNIKIGREIFRKGHLRKISYLGAVVDADDEAVIDVESTLCEFENWYAKVMKDVGEEDAVVQSKVSFPIQSSPSP